VHFIIRIGRVSFILKFNKGISGETCRSEGEGRGPRGGETKVGEAWGGGGEETNEFVSAEVLVGPREQKHSSVVKDERNERRSIGGI
jgi:hypothetical protein